MKEKLKELVHERQEDINMITKLFENNLKKVNSELAKVHEFIRNEGHTNDKKNKETLAKMIEEKVGVDEVQDALKRITDGFNFKIDELQEYYSSTFQARDAELNNGYGQMSDTVNKLSR